MFPTGRFRGARATGELGHSSRRMLMMSAGFNIEWSTFMASLLVGSIGIQWSRWYLAHPSVYRRGRDPDVSSFRLYRDDFRSKE